MLKEKIVCLAPVSDKPVTSEYIKQTYKEWIDFDKVDLVVIQAGRNTDQLSHEIADATILCSYGTPRILVPREILENAPYLKLIQQLGVGYDDIDIVAAEELGIPVCNTHGSNSSTVAEHTIMMILMHYRRALYADQSTREGEWNQVTLGTSGTLRELRDKTIGLIGVGSIGYEVAKLAYAFNAKIIYTKRHRLPAEEEKSVDARYVDLETLLSESDIISLHCPLTEETRNIIGAQELVTMKQGALLVNTSRGGLIDEKALIKAVDSGKLGGVALDVFDPEPPIGSPLLMSEKLVASPHISGISYEWFQRAFRLSGENMARAIREEKPVNVVY